MINSSSLPLSTLNDDEIKRIMSVIERDFKLRRKEYKRIEELKQTIKQEYERIERLTISKDFNSQRCIRCYKLFRRFFNPKELCSKCQLYVCHDCAINNKQMNIWTCKICLKIKELESLTGEWFYNKIGKKFKRCGSSKIVRQLYKREQGLANIDEKDEDLGYGTILTNNSNDSKDSIPSYVIHDKIIKSELNEYSKRLMLLIDNLKSDLSDMNTSSLIHNRESLKTHQQQITLEINRARIVLSGPIRQSNTQLNQTYENDLRYLLIQKTEQVLQTRFSQSQKNSLVQSLDFDQQLARIIYETKTADSIITDPSWETKSNNSSIPTIVVSQNVDTENITPTESLISDDKSDSLISKHRFIDTNPEMIKQSTQRVNNWQIHCPSTELESIPSDDEQVEFSTWL